MRDVHVMGMLTAAPMAQVPPVTICEQLNDLRVDDHFNHVYTYIFSALDAETMRVEVSDPEEQIRVLKQQDFEKQFNEQRNSKKDNGFSLPDNLSISDLVEFNKKLMSQVWAITNPSQMQTN